MLINSNWQYGYINQKRQTRYNTDGYCLDNWRAYNTDVIINSGSINIKSKAQDSYKHFSQITEHTLKAGNVYTITMLAKINSAENAFFRPSTKQLSGITGASGLKLTAGSKFELYSYTFIPTEDVESGTLDFIAGNGASHNYDIDLAAVKLEPGPRFTGWPVWNYALELAKCQRYQYYKSGLWKFLGIGICHGLVNGKYELTTFISLPVTMRTNPAAAFENLYVTGGVSTYKTHKVTRIRVVQDYIGGVELALQTDEALETGVPYYLAIKDTNGYFYLNANL